MTDVATAQPPELSLPARVGGVVVSPRSTYERIVAHPKVLGVLLLVTLVVVGLFGAFMGSDRGMQAFFDKQYDQIQQSNLSPDVQETRQKGVEQFEKFAHERPGLFLTFMAGSQVIGIPIVTVILAGLYFVVFNVIAGGTATFKQVMAVVAHAGVISALSYLVTIPLNYARGTLSSAANLGVLLPMVEETSFLGRLIGTIDLFIVWSLVVTAIGLSVTYRRKTGSIAMVLFGVYAVIALLIAYFRSM